LSKIINISHPKQNITAKQAVDVLNSNGLTVTEKEAQDIVDFLYKLAFSSAKNEKSFSIHKG
jgi:hypothetical protein